MTGATASLEAGTAVQVEATGASIGVSRLLTSERTMRASAIASPRLVISLSLEVISHSVDMFICFLPEPQGIWQVRAARGIRGFVLLCRIFPTFAGANARAPPGPGTGPSIGPGH